jgi:hypothetical protein
VHTTIWNASAYPWGRADTPAPILEMPVEHWGLLAQRRPGGNGAAFEDGYEFYEPVERIIVPLEPAASSPVIDS